MVSPKHLLQRSLRKQSLGVERNAKSALKSKARDHSEGRQKTYAIHHDPGESSQIALKRSAAKNPEVHLDPIYLTVLFPMVFWFLFFVLTFLQAPLHKGC